MPKLYTVQDYISMPWKNGLGSTLELFRLNDGGDSQNFLIRLSIADVKADGPFSLFPGIDRDLLILEGEGCRLIFDDHKIEIKNKYIPHHFSGDEEIECQLIAGAVRDFNVMVKRSWGSSHVEIIDMPGRLVCLEDYLFVYEIGNGNLHVLEKGESLEFNYPDNKKIVVRVRKII